MEVDVVGVSGVSTDDPRALLADALRIPSSALASLDPVEIETALARVTALADDRSAALDNVGIDQLTGTILGAAGHVVLQHAMNRSARTDEPLLLMMVVLEENKVLPGSTSKLTMSDHAILDVARRLAITLRSYDAIVRYGHDELLCILDNAELSDHMPRLNALAGELAHHGYVVNIGLAQLEGGDTLNTFVSRCRSATSR